MAKQQNPAVAVKAAENANDPAEEAPASSVDNAKQREIKGGVPYAPGSKMPIKEWAHLPGTLEDGDEL